MSSHDDHHLAAIMTTTIHTLLIDLGPFVHVTPHRECFTTYTTSDMRPNSLGDDHKLHIVGVHDIDL